MTQSESEYRQANGYPPGEDRARLSSVELIERSLHRVLGLWRPMLGWTLLVWAAVAVALGPLTSGVLGWQILRGDRMVIGNDEVVSWALSLPGASYLLLAGGLALTGAVLRYAGLFRMITDELESRPVSVRRTAIGLVPRLATLFRLCVVGVATGALLAVPLAAGLGGTYWVFLREHDINYYLTIQPSEWRWAIGSAAVWALLWIGVAGALVGRALPVVPAYLDGHTPLRAALRRSWSRTRERGKGWHLVRTLALAGIGWGVIRLVAAALVFWLGGWAIGGIAGITESLTVLALAIGGYLAVSFLVDACVGFLGFSTLAAVLTLFYHLDTDLHARIVAEERSGLATPGGAIRAVGGALDFRRLPTLMEWLRPGRLAGVATGLLVLSVGGSLLLLEALPEPRPVAVMAHRAGPPPAPENTLSALELSIAAGADYAEIDVLRTRDGTVVVVHDADLMRVAGDPRRVAEVDVSEIADLVQRPDDGTPASERRIATLAEFLERSRDRIRLNIELKYYGWDPGLAEATLREIREAQMEDQVVLMSLHLDAVQQLRALAPEIPIGYVSALVVGDQTLLPVDFLAVSRTQITPRLLAQAADRSIEVHAWTVNDAIEMADLIERGVHGLITDDPALAVAVRTELSGLSPVGRMLLRFRRVWDQPGEVGSVEGGGQ